MFGFRIFSLFTNPTSFRWKTPQWDRFICVILLAKEGFSWIFYVDLPCFCDGAFSVSHCFERKLCLPYERSTMIGLTKTHHEATTMIAYHKDMRPAERRKLVNHLEEDPRPPRNPTPPAIFQGSGIPRLRFGGC